MVVQASNYQSYFLLAKMVSAGDVLATKLTIFILLLVHRVTSLGANMPTSS